jgi:protein-tyrosine phosphatase
MHEVYWIDEGRVAGRCGPYLSPFDLEAMEAAGIGYILSLDAREAELIPPVVPAIEREVIHLTDSIPPDPGDLRLYLQRVPRALEYILERCGRNGKAVLVHCHAGNDRTGTVLAAYLRATRRIDPIDAIETVRDENPAALSALGYEEMALEILESLDGRE